MVLDTESIIEPEAVTQLKFAPQLFIAIMRRHAGFAPDMREMCEFHTGL